MGGSRKFEARGAVVHATFSEDIIMKRIILVAVIALLPALAACHTIQGAGKDVTAVGKGMESAAKN
jgi:predicted small secreted protein